MLTIWPIDREAVKIVEHNSKIFCCFIDYREDRAAGFGLRVRRPGRVVAVSNCAELRNPDPVAGQAIPGQHMRLPAASGLIQEKIDLVIARARQIVFYTM